MSDKLATILMVLMMFCHVVDDFYLQGILAKLKQKAWWKENAPDEKYEDDYVVALLVHAFSWSVMITVPYIVMMLVQQEYKITAVWIGTLLCNTIIHAVVDTLKCNRGVINLWTDQSIHAMQVMATSVVLAINWGFAG